MLPGLTAAAAGGDEAYLRCLCIIIIIITSIQNHEWQLPHAAVDDRATEPACRSDVKLNGTSETSAPELPRRDRSPKGRLSGPDRAPAGASAGFTDKKWRTAAASYDGADGARHTAAARTAMQPPSRCAQPNERRRISGQRRRRPRRLSPMLGGLDCPRGAAGARARTDLARAARGSPADRPRSAGPARTSTSRRARPNTAHGLNQTCWDPASDPR